MRLQYWLAILAGGVLVAASAAAVPNLLSSVDPNDVQADNKASPLPVQESQLRQAPQAQAPQTSQAPGGAPTTQRSQTQAPGSAPTTQRTETTKYDSWVVTCQEGAGTAKKSCSASLRVAAQGQNQRQQLVLAWDIGFNKDGRFVSAFAVPPLVATKKGDKAATGPLLVQNGVELKFGNGQARRLSFMWCGPKQCVAEGLIDDAFIKEALANTNANATITLYTADGTASPMEIPIKGIDKAISATRK
jgi:invasion protein IalB